MPCKTGTRETIEAGKRRILEERESELTDPLRRLWHDLVQRVHDTTDGFAALSETEKQYFAVSLLDGEIYNGGFDQFFFNHSGAYYRLLGLRDGYISSLHCSYKPSMCCLLSMTFRKIPSEDAQLFRKNISGFYIRYTFSSSMNCIGRTRTGCGFGGEVFAQRYKLI